MVCCLQGLLFFTELAGDSTLAVVSRAAVMRQSLLKFVVRGRSARVY